MQCNKKFFLTFSIKKNIKFKFKKWVLPMIDSAGDCYTKFMFKAALPDICRSGAEKAHVKMTRYSGQLCGNVQHHVRKFVYLLCVRFHLAV